GGGPVWVDLDGVDAETATRLLAPLRIHPIALEDLLTHVNRPKVDPYEHYLYLVVHSARWESDHRVALREIDMLIGRNFLVTYREGATRSLDAAHAVLARRGELLARGPAPLLHFILDVLVDHYLPIIDQVSAELDALEEGVFRSGTQRLQARILRLKRGMAALRRIVGPQRDTILALTRDEFVAIPAEIRPYLRDVYDRLARVSDLLDSYRDEITGLLDLYVSQVSQRLNQVMKTLTVISTVVLPLTLVTGYFGMNVKMAVFDWKYGELVVLAVVVLTATGTIAFLRRRDWL
ncbi:MAG: magnesium/cobalt transporter CorA, partial [Candidatus Eisenbacteria bacterium]|nr:magnesium/cobalt transporter CorA [Candidatus Eisenbacteria bacterium]